MGFVRVQGVYGMKDFYPPSFWSDRDVEGLSPEQKLTLLWIFTNPQMNVFGYFETSPKRFSFETGLESTASKRNR